MDYNMTTMGWCDKCACEMDGDEKCNCIACGKLLKDVEKIYIDYDGGCYCVMFQDESGFSILAKTRTRAVAERKVEKFSNHLRSGRLLRPEASVYKL